MNAKIEAFLQYIRYEKNYSELTLTNYQSDLCQFEDFVTALHGSFDPLKPDLDDARAWMADMGRQGLKSTSVKRRICALRSFYKYLRSHGDLTENPLRLLPTPKVPHPLPTWVREGQMDHLIDDVDYGSGFVAQRDRLLIDLLYSTGMRRAECAALKVRDVDFGRRTLLVHGKGNKDRLIPFGTELCNLMSDYLTERQRLPKLSTDSFFVRPNGAELGWRGVGEVAKHYLANVPNLDRRTTHVLRHSFATNMLAEGADLLAVKELLGHATLLSTEVYTHLTPQEIMESYNRAHPRAVTNDNNKKGV
jgi:integrase/recombinase XerC